MSCFETGFRDFPGGKALQNRGFQSAVPKYGI
jgi:hypothetical protein